MSSPIPDTDRFYLTSWLPDMGQYRKIWSLSWPIMVTNVLQILIIVVDTMMVGRLGPEDIAAIGMGNSIRLFLFILVLSVSSGAISLISQAYGTGDPQRMSNVVRQSMIAGIILSVIMAVLGFVLAPHVLSWMDNGGGTEIVREAQVYLNVIFLGLPFLVLNLIAERLIQGAGDTRLPLVLTIVTIILNIAFNYLLIYGWGWIPQMGVVGAAIGTIAARGMVLMVYLRMFSSERYRVGFGKGPWKPDWKLINRIVDIGLPSGLQGIFRRGTALFLVGFVTATELGTLGAAALTIGWQIESIIAQVVVGINVAGTSMVGFWLGRWRIKEAFKLGNGLMVLGVLMSLVLIAPIIFFPEFFIRIFDPSAHPDVLRGARGFLLTSVLTMPVAAVSIIATGAMRGAGDTRPPMYSTIWFRCFLTIILAYAFTEIFEMGFMGVWWAIVGGRIADTVYMTVLWVRRKWIQVALSKSPLYIVHLSKLPAHKMKQYLREIRIPLLSMDSTTEIVNNHDVTYLNEHVRTTVKFYNDKYEVKNKRRSPRD